MRKFKLAAGVSALAMMIGGSALAQGAPAHFLDEFPAKLSGHLSGLPIHSHPETDFLWVKLPDGNVVGGFIFDSAGNDIGAGITGGDPISAIETLNELLPDGASAAASQSGFVPVSNQASAAPVSAGLPPAPASTAPSAGFRPSVSATDPTKNAQFIEDMMAYANAALSNATDEQKAAWMADLIGIIDSAKTPTHLQLSVVEWAERVQGHPILDDAARAQMGALIAHEQQAMAPGAAPSAVPVTPISPISEINPDLLKGDALSAPVSGLVVPEITTSPLPTEAQTAPAPAPEPAKAQPAAQPASVTAAPTAALAGAADPTSETDAFFKAIQTDTAWLEIGNAAAPLVYMYADPLCPYCARAFANMENDVNNGELRLRVILAPLVNSKSGDTIAGILNSPNPSRALWDHEMEFARYGGSSLKTVDFSTLDDEMSSKIRKNYELAGQYNIPGVPFFAWETENGPKLLSGVPVPGHFKSSAIKPE